MEDPFTIIRVQWVVSEEFSTPVMRFTLPPQNVVPRKAGAFVQVFGDSLTFIKHTPKFGRARG